MTPAELTAYRDLCRRWPECCPEGLTDQRYKSWSLGDGDSGPIRDCEAEHIIIGHLETAVLDMHASGWWKFYSERRFPKYSVVIAGEWRTFSEESRLSSLLAAAEAVLGAKK